MAEYIEREALKQMITDEQIERHVSSGNHGYEIGYHNGLTMAQAMIIKAPSADVVEVVHGFVKFSQCNLGKFQSSQERYRW